MPSLNSLNKFFILSLLIGLVAFQRVALKSQVIVSGDAHYVQPGDPIYALLSLQWRVDLDLPNRHARLSSIVALEYLPPGDEVRSSGLPRATAQLHRQYALPAGAGDEIRLPLHLMATCGKAEVLLEVERFCLARIQALTLDGQIVLGSFGVHQYVHQLRGKARLTEAVGYGCDAFRLEK